MINESYNVYDRNDKIGIISNINGKLSFKPLVNDKRLPASFFDDYLGECKLLDPIPEERIMQFIEDRIMEEKRPEIISQLKHLDLDFYDEWRMFVKTNGMTYIDEYWIDSNGVTSFKEHIRNTMDFPIDKIIREKNKEKH